MGKTLWILVCTAAVVAFTSGVLTAAAEQTAFERLSQVRIDLAAAKAELGMYNCCIRPTCNFCALSTGMCPCGDGARSGDGVCGECLLGWRAGYGDIAGVDAAQVKPLSDDMIRMMYEVRAETMPGAADAGSGPALRRHAH